MHPLSELVAPAEASPPQSSPDRQRNYQKEVSQMSQSLKYPKVPTNSNSHRLNCPRCLNVPGVSMPQVSQPSQVSQCPRCLNVPSVSMSQVSQCPKCLNVPGVSMSPSHPSQCPNHPNFPRSQQSQSHKVTTVIFASGVP